MGGPGCAPWAPDLVGSLPRQLYLLQVFLLLKFSQVVSKSQALPVTISHKQLVSLSLGCVLESPREL